MQNFRTLGKPLQGEKLLGGKEIDKKKGEKRRK